MKDNKPYTRYPPSAGRTVSIVMVVVFALVIIVVAVTR